LIDAFGEHELSYVPMDLDDARWLVETIDRLRQQVTQLADALEAATRPLMDEKTQDILDGFMDSIKHPPGSGSMFDEEGE